MSITELIGNVSGAIRVGQLVDVDEEGRLWVDYADNSYGPMEARVLMGVGSEIQMLTINQSVLLVFENGDPCSPILVGHIEDRVKLSPERGPRPHFQVVADDKKIVIRAEQEIQLLCGKGSISLKQDGKIVLKGTKISSRSSGQNKIKGSAVSIN